MMSEKSFKSSFQQLTSPKLSHSYVRKFESAVKNFEQFVEEERLRKSLNIRSRFASFN